MSDLTQILPNCSTCIDLIFTDQPNAVADSGVHSSLHINWHHQITYCKLNLIIEYPLPSQRLAWDYKKANLNPIKQALYQMNWSIILSNKDVHQQVNVLNSIILNVSQTMYLTKLLPLMIKIHL